MQLTVQMSGLKELEAALKDLDKKLATKIARRAVAKGAGVIRAEARTRAKALGLVLSGAMVKNIALKREPKTPRTRTEYHVGVRHGAQAKNAKKVIGKKKNGKLSVSYENDPYYWWFVEFGHRIVPRGAGNTAGQAGGGITEWMHTLRNGKQQKRKKAWSASSITGRRRSATQTVPAKPFLRPAWEAKREAAAQMIADTLRTELLKAR